MQSNQDRVLLVDIGNTNLKWCWSDQLPDAIRGVAHGGASAAELADRQWGHLDRPGRVLIANVASPEWLQQLVDWMVRRWGIRPELAVSGRKSCGVTNAYEIPERLGVDRWLALVAAHHEGQSPACIVDCGTAVTLDVIDRQGLHQGGLILPGPRLMKAALLRGTRIPEAQDERPEEMLGQDTRSAIGLAPLLAIAGMVEKVMREHPWDDAATPNLILTGADAGLLASRLGIPAVIQPDLVLRGLLLAAGKSS